MQPLLIKTDTLEEIVTDFDYSSFVYEWQKNQQRQISFTITKTQSNSFIFDLLQNEIHVIRQGQEYVIKQCAPKSNGRIITKDITATHVMYECQKTVWQYDTQGAEDNPVTMSISDVMNWYFNGNTAGFTWEVKGSFPNHQFTGVGDGSGMDGINKCVDTWGCNVWADNKHIILMDDTNWKKITSNQFRYLYNTDGVQASIDTTTVTNTVKCFPKMNQDDEGNNTGYVFAPFIHQNSASVSQWGTCYMAAIRDDRFTDQNSMDTYAEAQLHPDPDISLSLTYQGNQDVNEGDVWLFINEPLNFDADVTIVGLQIHDYSTDRPVITFSNTQQDIFQIQREIAQMAKKANTSAGNALIIASSATAGQIVIGTKVGEA